MYLAIDLGGSKTLVAVFDSNGAIVEQIKFPTAHKYEDFISELVNNVANLTTKDLYLACMAVPGLINRQTGVVYALGNLPWIDKPIRQDVSNVLNGLKVVIENDARLGGLGASQAFKQTYENILFLSISTGIGGALIAKGKIVKAVQDMEIGKIPLQFEGKLQHWEEFASGRAIVATYGKRAEEIDDPNVWQEIGVRIGYGTAIASSAIQPDVIIFGGGAGKHAEKFIPTVRDYMYANMHADTKRPELLVAQNPEEAVIYGCYELAKSLHENST